MRTLRFYGHSDDLFEIEDTCRDESDEIGSFDRPSTVKVSDGNGRGLFVTAHYAVCGEGTWMLGISPLDEDVPLPDWPMRWSAQAYSAVLEIDVPKGVSVKNIREEDE